MSSFGGFNDSLALDTIMEGQDEIFLLFQLMLLCYGCWLFTPSERNPSVYEQRLMWEEYSQRHIRRGSFKIRLRMSPDSFDTLLSWLRADLEVEEAQAARRGGAIIPELCLFCTLRYLAGGSYLDICDIAGISKASFYRVVWKTIKVIVKCKELEMRFPQTPEEIGKAIRGFSSISFNNAISNCVGVIDGYLLRIKTPSKREVGNVKSYFSGHYQCYGVNVQAVCDHHSRFIYIAFTSPGVTGDRDAVRHCGVDDLIEKLPFGICIIGDCAYEPTEHLVPIYQGLAKLNKRNDSFNFYASQCWIRIEMAFGLMQIKWGILQRPIGCTLSNLKWMLLAIARLHNFVISERVAAKGSTEEMRDPRSGSADYLPSTPHDQDGNIVDLNPLVSAASHTGYSELRERMAERVAELGLERPKGNRLGKRKRDDM